jgi:hypothetical protein
MTPWSISTRRIRAAGQLYGQAHMLNTMAATATARYLASGGRRWRPGARPNSS